jgi:hypothetical protein
VALTANNYQHRLLTTFDSVYVVGGRQRVSRSVLDNDQTWYEYEKGIILRVDLQTGCAETCLEYLSPPEAAGDNDPILFKSGTADAGRLYLCTQTELLVYDLPDFERTNYISLPYFNDVHHVRPMPNGNLLVANSGLEMVVELTPKGQTVQAWNVLGEDPWQLVSPEVDYRRGISTKPHRAHPNYVFLVEDDIWATRFEQKDALCLTQPGCSIHIGLERVHDGVLYHGRLYFTTVNGYLVIANPHTCVVEETINLNAIHEEDTLLGWCRGVLLDGSRAWIGFSRIRPTRFRETLSWVRQGFRRSLPTHIACYDLAEKRLLAEINLEDQGLNAIFSIFPTSIKDLTGFRKPVRSW